jgi:hypothetical protein
MALEVTIMAPYLIIIPPLTSSTHAGRIVEFNPSIQRPDLLIPTVQFDNGVTCTIGPVEYNFKGIEMDGWMDRSIYG